MRKRSSSSTVVVLLLLALGAAYYFYQKRQEPKPVPGPVAGKLTIHFLDIGQGDAELIQLPDGETILIDSGDRGAPTVDLLKRYGVKDIDLIIATHPHSDHIGEMDDVMRAFKVKEFWDSGFPYSTKTYGNMLQAIKDQKIKFSTPRRGDTRQIGQVMLEVLNPPKNLKDLPDDNPNNASLVVRLTFGGKRFLFTGDTEEETWKQMIGEEKGKLQADLLKAAHHGSSNGTTEEVLAAVNPSIITISCAVGNDYHHPHPKVVRMLDQRRKSTDVYRTDLEGTITAVCDGKNIEMSTEKQVARDRLYLTGDEVAGKVAGEPNSKSSGRRSR